MSRVYQVNGADGRRTYYGFDLSNLRPDEVANKEKINTKELVGEKVKKAVLGDLIGHRTYDFLARYAMEDGVSLRQEVFYGTVEGTQVIHDGRADYRYRAGYYKKITIDQE